MVTESEELPLFVYGSLKPGELAHEQIATMVRESALARLDGYGLWVRDGLPFAATHTGESVPGYLLFPRQEATDEFYRVVRAYEGSELYSEQTVVVDTPSGGVEARAFIGRRASRGHPEAMVHGAWSVRTDPLFVFGLDAVHRSAVNLLPKVRELRPGLVETAEFWDAFVPLQGLYLVLSSVVERYATLRFGQSLPPTEKFAVLDRDPRARAAVEEARPPEFSVVDSRSANSPRSTSRAPFTAWYQVRNNLTHRGKGGYHDIDLVRDAVIGLHDTMRHLIGAALTEPLRGTFTSPVRMLRTSP